MRPEPGTVLHFSEDPDISVFRPHVAKTAQVGEAYVWAVDAARAPDYWFPRQCPRAMAWPDPDTTAEDRLAILGPSATRVHMIEYGWLAAMQTVRLFAYRFDAADFVPYGDEPVPVAQVATHPVRPLGPPEPVGDLLALHAEAGIELRLAESLLGWWDAVVASTVGFSGIRLRNAVGFAAPPEVVRPSAPG
ncbi:MAG: DUF6886 family protein [Propionibacteriaceae bacterium]